jgi:hypothetical protein
MESDITPNRNLKDDDDRLCLVEELCISTALLASRADKGL